MVRKKLSSLLILLFFTFNILAALNLNMVMVSAFEYPAIYIEPATTVDPTLTPGKNYTISIETNYTGNDIQSWQFTLSYNASVLRGVKVTNGDLITTAKNPNATFIAGTFNNTVGTLSLTAALFFFISEPAPMTSGPGTLATVTFTVVGIGESNITIGPATKLIGYTESGYGDPYNIVDAETMPNNIGHGYFSNVPPRLYVDPESIVDPDLTPGENFTININIKDVTDLYTFDFCLNYTTTVLTATKITLGSFYPPGAKVWKKVINDPLGYVRYIVSMPTGTPPGGGLNGSGTLAIINFTVDSSGESLLDLCNTKLSNSYAAYIDHDVYDGYFSNIAPPVADANGPYSGSEGTPITFDASGSTPDGGGIVLYEWDWDNDGTYDESTTSPTIDHAWPDDHAGTVGLRVTDSEGQNDTDTALVTVHNVAPTVDAGPDRTVRLGQTVNFTGNFTDSGTKDTHTIFWDFGDGSNASGTLTPTHNYTEADVYTVTLNVTDDDGGVGLDTLRVTVSAVAVHDVAVLSVAPNATKVIQGYAVSITVVARNEGTETESFNVTAYANTTEIETQSVTDLGAGTQTTLSFIWDTAGVPLGSYTLSANASVVSDETETVDNTHIDGIVNVNTPPVASDPSISPPSPKTTDNLVGNYTYYDAEGDSESGTEIRWYKNDVLQPAYDDTLIIPSSATAKGETWYFTVRPKDGLEFGTLQTSPSVTVQNSPPTADADGPYEGDEGSPIIFNASGSSDPDGDALQYRWDFDNDETWDTEYSTDPTASYTWRDDYSGTIVVEVYDGGLTDTDTVAVTANNVAPTVEAGSDQTVYVGQTVSFTGNFTDPGTKDTHTIFWDFGDRTNTTGTLTPTHVYTNAGIYTVILKVTDDNGGVGTDTLTLRVSLVPVHDVAVTNITASSFKVNITDPTQLIVTISVEVANKGNRPETFNVTITYDSEVIGTKTVTLAAGDSTTVNFDWDVRDVALRKYTIQAEAILDIDANKGNNKMTSDWVIEIVPEFPTLIPLLLILAFLAVSTIVLKRRKDNNR